MTSPAPSPLIQFWEETYGEFSFPLEGGVGFRNSQFPDPIMSPNFVTSELQMFLESNPRIGHFNLVTAELPDQELLQQNKFQCVKKFTVGVRNLKKESPDPQDFSTDILPLREAIQKPYFWPLIAEGFEKDLPFLKVLLPFLADAPARFMTIVLENQGHPAALITVGLQKDVALVLNAVVKQNARKTGLSHKLVAAVKNYLLQEKVYRAFFWTELPFLQNHAHQTQHYLVYKRS